MILFYSEPSYWGFLNIAKKYSVSSDDEKNALSDLARIIFKTKDIRFKFAMICWSIGALAFSIVLVTSEVIPQIIGWLGIVASILVFFSNGIKLGKTNIKVPAIVALFPILFEVTLGGWLLFSTLI